MINKSILPSKFTLSGVKNVLFITFSFTLLAFSPFVQAQDRPEGNVEAPTNQEQKKETAPLPIKDLHLFAEVMETLKKDYVEDVSDQELIHLAIEGMLSGLDPHSEFFNQESFQSFQNFSQGQFAGVGIEVVNEDGLLRIISPIDGSPAQQAGILAGDLIIRVDDTAVQSTSIDEAIKLLRGEVGSKVLLTIVRENEAKPLKFELERSIIKTKSVNVELLDDALAYVRITQFQERTAQDLKIGLENLVADQKRIKRDFELQGLILDLRNNPGGLLDQAVEVSDLFLDSGLIVYTQGKQAASRKDFNAKEGDVLNAAPLIVLINAGSASASEIVAGALQDQKRAMIVGEKSFGKGSVQVSFALRNGGGMKFTTARYYTPSGRSIQAEGIVPDLSLLPLSVQLDELDEMDDLTLREADLDGHLNGGSMGYGDDDDAILRLKQLAERDYMLFQSLNLLKAMSYNKSQINHQYDAYDLESLKSMQ